MQELCNFLDSRMDNSLLLEFKRSGFKTGPFLCMILSFYFFACCSFVLILCINRYFNIDLACVSGLTLAQNLFQQTL